MRFIIALLLVGMTQAFAFQVKVGEAPFNDLALTIQTIESARSHLLVNIYDLSSKDVAAALIERVQAGVQVEILEEGQPVGGLPYAAREIQAQITKAMSEAGAGNHLYVMTSKNPESAKRRFRYDHAKYIVVDGGSLLIGSENYSPTGNPSPGKLGNRGWEVLVSDAGLAASFSSLFGTDADTRVGDVIEITAGSSAKTLESPVEITNAAELGRLANAMPVLEANSATAILSPESSLSGLTNLLDSAKSSIDIQQMTVDSQWGKDGGQSPLVDGLIAAARRGVKVRVLLNDETVFDRKSGKPGRRKNQETADMLNQLAQSENLQLEARIADVKAMGVDYIHNKGALVDGQLTLISSINWDQNSVESNRESAVVLDGAEINGHYLQLFDKDWQASGDGIREN